MRNEKATAILLGRVIAFEIFRWQFRKGYGIFLSKQEHAAVKCRNSGRLKGEDPGAATRPVTICTKYSSPAPFAEARAAPSCLSNVQGAAAPVPCARARNSEPRHLFRLAQRDRSEEPRQWRHCDRREGVAAVLRRRCSLLAAAPRAGFRLGRRPFQARSRLRTITYSPCHDSGKVGHGRRIWRSRIPVGSAGGTWRTPNSSTDATILAEMAKRVYDPRFKAIQLAARPL